MQKSLVSIIVPFYKGEGYISNAIKSILKQTYKKFELILIENGPKDNSEEIIKGFNDDRIKYYYLTEGNISNSRNYGIEKATGEYVYFMDGDDTVDFRLFEKCIKEININKVDLVMFNYNKVSSNEINKVLLPWHNEVLKRKDIRDKLIPKMIHAKKREKPIAGTVWRVFTYFDNVKDLRFNNDILIAEDLIFNIELFSSVNSIYILDECLYNYTLNASSSLNSYKKDVIYQSITFHKVLKNILIKESLFEENKERFYQNQGKMYTTAISFSVRSNDRKISIPEIKNIIKIYKRDSYNYLKLEYPVSIKISFILMNLNLSSVLYIIYKYKEKNRIKKHKKI